MSSHTTFMQAALALARQGEYTCAPNPMVGCVIVRDGRIVGEGWHEKPGAPHAEVNALQAAGALAQGATVYVNLEPCAHYGRTPPCVDALIKANVKAVYIPFLDPNSLVNGAGAAKLKAAGIEVIVGECAAEAKQLNEVFLHYITKKRPFVIAKWAMSLDGKLATHTGHSHWITGAAARLHVHETRQKVAAILIGAKTAINDNPQLTVRLADVKTTNQPLRIILASKGDLAVDLQVLNGSLPGKTLVVTTALSSRHWREEIIKLGNEVLVLPADKAEKINLTTLLDELGRREISSLLVEGGSQVHTAFLAQKLVNKIHAYVAPKLIGGENAPTPFAGVGIDKMINAEQLAWEKWESMGEDIFLQARFSE